MSGDPSAARDTSVFMTSTYGPLADPWTNVSGLYNYALFMVGSQPKGAGTPFVVKVLAICSVSCSCPRSLLLLTPT